MLATNCTKKKLLAEMKSLFGEVSYYAQFS